MIGRKAELRKKIDGVIERLQAIQRTVGGSRQPASSFELEELKELGRRYAELNKELKNYIKGSKTTKP